MHISLSRAGEGLNKKFIPIKRLSFFCILFSVFFFFFSGCGEDPIQEDPITRVNFDEAEFAPFVEREFPFITTFLMGTYNDEWMPENNITARCLALILGDDAYACFDTDLLRWSAAWTGDFVPMETMAQVSYHNFFERNRTLPALPAPPHLVTGLYPGWNAGEPLLSDPRPPAPHPDEPSWGPLPEDIGRWNGVYVTDEGPVLSYTIDGVDIYETPGSIESGEETLFTRTFRVAGAGSDLSLVAAEILDSDRSEVQSERAEIYHRDGETVTVITLSGANGTASIDLIEDRYATVRVSGREEQMEFTLVVWKGDTNRVEEVDNILEGASFSTHGFDQGSSNLWPDIVRTRGNVSPDTAAYVVDELTLPIPNPWRRNVRVVDAAFFDDNRVAVVTFEGDIWIVDGIDSRLRDLRWSRFASGLYETQSIEIVNNEIYVYGKEGIVRLHDLNGNGSADFYENFSNLIHQSIETREWASDMVAKPDGGFYVAKGGALDMGPRGLTDPVYRGFRSGSMHTGVILEVSEDGRSISQFASGLRGPYLGIHPESGVLTASDQEGHSVPSTPVLVINRGDYFGVSATAHRDPIPDVTPPLLWIPHNVDRSGISQAWITGDRMGPLSGRMIHFSYGRPGLFSVLIDSTESGIQGGVSVIPGNYPAPTMKGTVSPSDGQLYSTGFTIWDTNSDGVTAFIRLRYTGMPSYLPTKFSVRDGGIVLRFDVELDESSVQELSNYRVERWNYLRTEDYGSGHFRLDGSPGQEVLPVFSAHLSDDGKGVFLAIPNIEEAQQMQLSYILNAVSGDPIIDDFWFSVNHVEPVDLLAEGFSGIDFEDLLADVDAWVPPDETAGPVTVERGRELFQRTGCMGCHTIDGSEGTERGPTLQGLFGKERTFRDGSSTIADEEYIRQTLVNPSARIVEGYDEGMPSFLGILSDDEIDSIVLYIKSLE